jgi:hypothetical protein
MNDGEEENLGLGRRRTRGGISTRELGPRKLAIAKLASSCAPTPLDVLLANPNSHTSSLNNFPTPHLFCLHRAHSQTTLRLRRRSPGGLPFRLCNHSLARQPTPVELRLLPVPETSIHQRRALPQLIPWVERGAVGEYSEEPPARRGEV